MLKSIFDLDMTPNRTLPLIVNVSQYDDIGRTLVFNLFSSSGKWTAPTSAAVTFEGGKPDGKFFAYNCAYSSGTVTVTIQQQMTAVAGKVRCKVKVKSGDKVVESAPIIMVVDAAAVPDGSDMSKSDINDAIANATQKIVDQVKDNIPSDYSQLSTDVSSLKEDLPNYLKVKETVLETDNLLDINDLTVGYVTLDGRINSRDGFKYTRLEPVTPNMTYTVWRMIWRNNFEVRFVTFYDKEKNVISNAGVEMTTSFTTTDSTYYVIMTFTDNENITLDREPMVTEGTELPTEYKPYRNEFVDYVTEYVKKADFDSTVKEIDEKIKNKTLTTLVNCADFKTSSIINSGENINIEASNSKQNNTIGFFCNIDSDFESIRISHGITATHSRSSFVVIDNTNVILYSDKNTIVATYPHGLTLSDFIACSIMVGNKYKANIALCTSNGYFNQKDIDWNGCTETVKAESISGTLTNAKLSWYVSDYNHKTWCYGDSYFDFWIPYIKNYLGLYGYMQDSYSGRTSSNALASFKLAIKKATPQNILWCMGMNDPDSDTEINTSWKNTYDELSAICDDKGINLILVTIPNTPERNHTFKNDFIKTSDRRYVDIAHVLGADSYPSSWYDGLISDDNTHPGSIATRIIANEMIIGCPEITEIIN